MRDKIYNLAALLVFAQEWKEKERKKIVYAHGAFDLLHAGHIHHLEEAKKLGDIGDILIVTITPDRFIQKGPGRPRFNEEARVKFVSGLECVDFVALNDSAEATETIKRMRPDIYAKGEDVKEKSGDPKEGLYREIKAVEETGGEVRFIKSLPIHSTDLLNEHFPVYSKETDEFLDKFSAAHGAETIFEFLERIKKLKVLVIGDAIIDQYQYVVAATKSPKSNHMVAKALNGEEFAGGVLACANHIAEFCDEVELATCLGFLDSGEEFIRRHLRGNIVPFFLYRSGSPTTIKRRFVEPAYLTKLFEVNHLDESDLPENLREKLLAFLEKNLGRYDLILAADYGHGFLTGNIIALLSREAKFLATNVQTNSTNYGFNLVTKYPRADYVCIDEPEVRLATHNREGDLKKLIEKISRKTQARKISITRGHQGCLVFGKPEGFCEIPVLSTRVVDTVGAGDAFFSASAPFASLDASMEIVGFIGNVAGAIKVGTLCNKSSVSAAQLKEFIERLLAGRQ